MQSNMSVFKVTHHIKKLQETLIISGNGDIAANETVEKLLENYKEYQFEPREKLHATVKEVLANMHENALAKMNTAKGPVTVTAVASLNQMMQNQYNKSASKRQRPADLDAVQDVIEGIANGGINVEQIPAETPSEVPSKSIAAAAAKKKKSTTSNQSAMLNPLLVINVLLMCMQL